MTKGKKRARDEIKENIKKLSNEEKDDENLNGVEESASSGSESDEMQDEFEIEEDEDGGISEESEENDNYEDQSDENDSAMQKPAKKSRQEQFGSAVNAILSSKVKAHDRDNPILIRRRTKLRDLESDKLNAKAKHAISQDKKALEDKDRIKNILEPIDGKSAAEMQEHEKKLKKIGQKGVVRLFNALQASHQVQENASVKDIKRQEHVNEMSKEKFLDLIRAGGKK